MTTSIKKLGLLSLLMLTASMAFGMEETKTLPTTFNNFEQLPKDLQINIVADYLEGARGSGGLVDANIFFQRIKDLSLVSKNMHALLKSDRLQPIVKELTEKAILNFLSSYPGSNIFTDGDYMIERFKSIPKNQITNLDQPAKNQFRQRIFNDYGAKDKTKLLEAIKHYGGDKGEEAFRLINDLLQLDLIEEAPKNQ